MSTLTFEGTLAYEVLWTEGTLILGDIDLYPRYPDLGLHQADGTLTWLTEHRPISNGALTWKYIDIQRDTGLRGH